MAATLRPLRLPGFRHLAGAYLVNELGDWLGSIALAVLVFDQTGSALATAALFLATQFVPALLAPPIVARIEVLHSRRSLPILYAAEAAAFAALGLLADGFVLGAVLAVAALDGALAGSARALTRGAAGAVLSPAGLLREGNAILNIGFTAGAAIGPAIAGLIVAGAGVRGALFADAASFLIVASLLAFAKGLPRSEPEAAGWRERLRNGLSYVRERPVLRRLLGAQAAAFVFFSAVIPVEIVFAKETLGAGDSGYGALLASWGAGMVVGSLMFAVVSRRSLGVLLAVSTVTIGCAYLGTAAAPTLLVACLASAVGGAGNGIQWVALVSAVQEVTRTSYHARVIALLESLSSAMPGLGFVLGGAVATLFDPRAAFALAGVGVILVAAAAAASLRRAGWSGQEPEPIEFPDVAPAPLAGTGADTELPGTLVK
jgi:MFS family permease